MINFGKLKKNFYSNMLLRWYNWYIDSAIKTILLFFSSYLRKRCIYIYIYIYIYIFSVYHLFIYFML